VVILDWSSLDHQRRPICGAHRWQFLLLLLPLPLLLLFPSSLQRQTCICCWMMHRWRTTMSMLRLHFVIGAVLVWGFLHRDHRHLNGRAAKHILRLTERHRVCIAHMLMDAEIFMAAQNPRTTQRMPWIWETTTRRTPTTLVRTAGRSAAPAALAAPAAALTPGWYWTRVWSPPRSTVRCQRRNGAGLGSSQCWRGWIRRPGVIRGSGSVCRSTNCSRCKGR